MHGLTDYITTQPWVDIFTTWYVLVDDAYAALVAQGGRLRQRGPAPTFSDSEVITIALITETFFHGHEELCLRFMRQYHRDLFPHLVDDTRFNRRRRALAGGTEVLRRMYTTWLLAPDDPVRVVDSAPIPVCTYMRSRSCQTVAGAEYCGMMVSRRAKLFGFRLHVTTTTNQVLDQWMLAPASHHDGTMTPALLEDAPSLWIVGDNAFHNPYGSGVVAAPAPDCARGVATPHGSARLAYASAATPEQRAPDDRERIERIVYGRSSRTPWFTAFRRVTQPDHHAALSIHLIVRGMGVLAFVGKLALTVLFNALTR